MKKDEKIFLKHIPEKIVEECKEKFGENLVSIVLFGSHARGKAKATSDIDLLVVLEKLPTSISKSMKLEKNLSLEFTKKYEKIFQILLFDKEDFRSNLSSFSPLFISLTLGFRILFDRWYFGPMFRDFVHELSKHDFKYYEGGKEWSIKKESLRLLQSRW